MSLRLGVAFVALADLARGVLGIFRVGNENLSVFVAWLWWHGLRVLRRQPDESQGGEKQIFGACVGLHSSLAVHLLTSQPRVTLLLETCLRRLWRHRAA